MRPARRIVNGNLECAHCWQWKPLPDFYPSKDSAVGRDSYCKICRRAIKSEAAKRRRLSKWFTKTPAIARR